MSSYIAIPVVTTTPGKLFWSFTNHSSKRQTVTFPRIFLCVWSAGSDMHYEASLCWLICVSDSLVRYFMYMSGSHCYILAVYLLCGVYIHVCVMCLWASKWELKPLPAT